MAKLNENANMRTLKQEGHAAYAMDGRTKLVTQVLTSFFHEDKFYGDNSADMAETIEQTVRTDPAFVANLAVYARRVFHMRSVSHVLLGYLAHAPEGKPYARGAVRGAVLRGDDATEILAFYLNTFGKPLPNSLRKGLADAFGTFDEYTLAKYRARGKAVKMRDVLCLCRPTPRDAAQSDLWKRLLEDRLNAPLTWETQLSARGNTKEVWEALIDSGRMGYMATLRNLRNIIDARPDNLQKVYDLIADPQAVRRSRQLPFRFLAAYKAAQDIAGSRCLSALESAAEAAVANVPRLPGRTVIAVDGSGSMSNNISRRSSVTCAEVGMMLGMMAERICDDSVFYVFDNKIQKCPVSGRTGILYAALHQAQACGGTDMGLPFRKMMEDGVLADRVIVISDNMCNCGYTYGSRKTVQSLADRYRAQTGIDLWVHAIDLMGYGTQQFAGPKTNIIAGWSERALDFILLAEQGAGSLEKTIADYRWEADGAADEAR